MMIAIRMTDNAPASAKSPTEVNRSWIALPTMRVLGLPSSSALMKSPAAGMKVSSVPATTPGIDSGHVTLKNPRAGEAYRSLDASINRMSIFSRLAYSGSTMNGRKL
jgi:hypothetical protein